MEIPVELSKTLITEHGEQQLVFLKEIDGPRTFPIVIGISEALAIDRRLKNIPTPRPMTHDLVSNIIDSLGGTLEKIVINDLRDHTFFATIYISTSEGLRQIDSRPSDALAIGVGLGTPLFVSEKVLDSITNSETASRKERLEILRRRLEILSEQIHTLNKMLDDTDFLDTAPQETIDEYRKQVEEMENEKAAIENLLKKYD